jgi:hypothetical protein
VTKSILSLTLWTALLCAPPLQAQTNTLYGFGALQSNTTGTDNAAFGYGALRSNTAGRYNTATGSGALANNTWGRFNVAHGAGALMFTTTGDDNTAVGTEALSLNSVGFWNTAVGDQALFSNIGPSRESPSGYSGVGNTATGHMALFFNTFGHGNVANGIQALYSNTTASNGVAVGNGALFSNTTGQSNTAVGVGALEDNTKGEINAAVGRFALSKITTGSSNAAIGAFSGGWDETNNSTFLGSGARSDMAVFNSTAVGSSAVVTGDNQVRFGNTLVTSIGGPVGFTTFSDSRYKANVREDVPGLVFIAKLRPVTYTVDVDGIDGRLKAMRHSSASATKAPAATGSTRNLHGEIPAGVTSFQVPVDEWKPAEETEEERRARDEKASIVYTGFLAQEVELAAQELNYQFSGVDAPKNEEDFYGLRYAEFVVPLVKAVQELAAENTRVQTELSDLKAVVAKLTGERP